MKQNYDFEEYFVNEFVDSLKKEEIILPRFQRDLVWSNTQIVELADSLKKGIPFGTFLLAGEKPHKLLDGLQRANAITKIYHEPQKFFRKDQVPQEIIDQVKELFINHGATFPEDYDEGLRNDIAAWVTNQKDTNPAKNFNAFMLGKHLFSLFSVKVDGELPYKASEILSPLIESIVDEINNIGSIKIPCIIYKGSDEHLPLIFEKINSTGTKLSRFQIFAANWADNLLPRLKDEEIKRIVFREYESRIKEGNINIEHFSEIEAEFLEQDLNLYEYLLGLGMVMEKAFPYLFFNKGDSIGFTLTSACLQGSIRKIYGLDKIIDDRFNFTGYKKALLDSIKIVFDTLRPFICLKINKSKSDKNENPIIFHSDYQIISFVAKVFREKYNLETFESDDNWNTKKAWIDNIPFHYLYDQIEDNWRGSGDKRIEDMLDSPRYRSVISKAAWEKNLLDWFRDKEMTKNQSRRTSIDSKDILFLNYIYTHVFTNFEVEGNVQFHLEHLIPVKTLTSFLASGKYKNGGLPISAISNLCYLEAELNQKKGNKTIYEYIKDQPDKLDISKIEEKCTFTKESDMDFVDLLTGNQDEGWDDFYFEFLNKRFATLINKFLNLNNIN